MFGERVWNEHLGVVNVWWKGSKVNTQGGLMFDERAGGGGGGEVNRGWSCGLSGEDNTQKCTIDLMCKMQKMAYCRVWFRCSWSLLKIEM